MAPPYFLNSLLMLGVAGICSCALCGGGGCAGAAGWFCDKPADDCAGGAVICCPGVPGAPGGGLAKIFRNSFTSSCGCRVIATRFLSEAIFVFGLACGFCKSGGRSRNVMS